MQSDTDALLTDAYRYRFLRNLAMADDDTQDRVAKAMEAAMPPEGPPLDADQFDAAVDAGMKAL